MQDAVIPCRGIHHHPNGLHLSRKSPVIPVQAKVSDYPTLSHENCTIAPGPSLAALVNYIRFSIAAYRRWAAARSGESTP